MGADFRRFVLFALLGLGAGCASSASGERAVDAATWQPVADARVDGASDANTADAARDSSGDAVSSDAGNDATSDAMVVDVRSDTNPASDASVDARLDALSIDARIDSAIPIDAAPVDAATTGNACGVCDRIWSCNNFPDSWETRGVDCVNTRTTTALHCNGTFGQGSSFNVGTWTTNAAKTVLNLNYPTLPSGTHTVVCTQ